MTKTENEIEQKTNMSSNDYNLDFGLLIGTDIMLTQHIGSRLSYYYGLAKVLSEDVLLSIDESNLNVINVGVNAQLLIRLNPSN